MSDNQISQALELICSIRGYKETGIALQKLAAQNRIRFDREMEDRAQTGLLGNITLGPEAIASNTVSLAQTLVHEAYHLHQNPFLKTVSFWTGFLTHTPVMRRYEQPAYQAAIDFLADVKRTQPHLAQEAEREQNAMRCVFANDFGVTLR